ncbi:MAG: hypothetical protein M0C28_01365 [Candidatus Moduliflexus flocculans]|nr:hypothetical protein [Candidatus Moduliflexus flocculans]
MGLGFGLIVFPTATKAMMGFPGQDPAVLGLLRLCPAGGRPDRDPRPSRSLEIRPLLLLQLVYKPLWLVVFAIPLFLEGPVPEVCRRHVRRLPHLYHRRSDRHPVRLPVLEEKDPL